MLEAGELLGMSERPGDLALELGKRQQHVEGQPAHRGGGIELLGHRDEGDGMGVNDRLKLPENQQFEIAMTV
jgi:hypothetical protein